MLFTNQVLESSLTPSGRRPGVFTSIRGTGSGGLPPSNVYLPFCGVTDTLRPSNDSEIRIEVWMLLAGWNGKFQGVGNGGYAGTISTPPAATALSEGWQRR